MVNKIRLIMVGVSGMSAHINFQVASFSAPRTILDISESAKENSLEEDGGRRY